MDVQFRAGLESRVIPMKGDFLPGTGSRGEEVEPLITWKSIWHELA